MIWGILILSLVYFSNCKDLYYLTIDNQYLDTKFFQCFTTKGYTQLLFSVDQTTFITDFDKKNIINAKNAGIAVDISFLVNVKRSPDIQINNILRAIGVNTITRLWINLMLKHGHSLLRLYSPQSNCAYLQKFIQISQKNYGIPVGIYSDSETWQQAFESQTACPEASSIPLWWSPSFDEQNYQPNFANYHQIGGWSLPYMKFYNVKEVCSQFPQVLYYA